MGPAVPPYASQEEDDDIDEEDEEVPNPGGGCVCLTLRAVECRQEKPKKTGEKAKEADRIRRMPLYSGMLLCQLRSPSRQNSWTA